MNRKEIIERLQTLTEDVCHRGDRMSLSRLVLDVVEPFELIGFTEAFSDEFELPILPGEITEETTFRDLVDLAHQEL
jgi:hypothetical protein